MSKKPSKCFLVSTCFRTPRSLAKNRKGCASTFTFIHLEGIICLNFREQINDVVLST